ncbi:MAG: recombinase family protein [Proteobacteria bacterium]|nr:recombinase family protein [Pseudomonadota bacterium]
MRAALYIRVSTRKQAEQDLSIPDQQRQLRDYCRRKNYKVVREYIEPGASATTDDRPMFQRMISDAEDARHPYDIILVHSYSRFAREAIDAELYIRSLAKANVKLASITQEMGDDAGGHLARRMIALFDEHASREGAKHTLRAMKENAKQGYWNGSAPPFGYRVVDAERRGDKIKKTLEVYEPEAKIVRQFFTLYLAGDGKTGPMGIKNIVSYLNGRGRTQRNGKPFHIKFVHEALRNTAYIGKHYFNRKDSRTNKRKPMTEWVEMKCPAIVDHKTFSSVKKLLAERNPRKTPTRVTSNSILLSQIARCSYCNGAMTLRAGKSGRYRYYACSTWARVGASACKGNKLSMPTLDALVTDALLDRILTPERMRALIQEVRQSLRSGNGDTRRKLKQLHGQERAITLKINRLYEAIENGLVGDVEVFRGRLSTLHAELEETKNEIEATREASKGILPVSSADLSSIALAFGRLLREGDLQLRKAYFRLFIQEVEVGSRHINIVGSKEALAHATASMRGKRPNTVPVSMAGWRPRRDLNARPPD